MTDDYVPNKIKGTGHFSPMDMPPPDNPPQGADARDIDVPTKDDKLLFVCKDGWAHYIVNSPGGQRCEKCSKYLNDLVDEHTAHARIDETNKWALEIIKCKNPLELPQYIYDYHQRRIAELKSKTGGSDG